VGVCSECESAYERERRIEGTHTTQTKLRVQQGAHLQMICVAQRTERECTAWIEGERLFVPVYGNGQAISGWRLAQRARTMFGDFSIPRRATPLRGNTASARCTIGCILTLTVGSPHRIVVVFETHAPGSPAQLSLDPEEKRQRGRWLRETLAQSAAPITMISSNRTTAASHACESGVWISLMASRRYRSASP
jgi:hypothetical protein